LYYKASWCPPCRQFTPIVAEMYDHLKDVHPTNGLEIVLCGSDRDESSFNNYYSHHPWKAIPFEFLQGRGGIKQSLDETYSVRGIPCLVILDSATGNVVVPGRESPQEILNAVVYGEEGLEGLFQSWIDRIPDAVHVGRVIPSTTDRPKQYSSMSRSTTRSTFQQDHGKPRTVLQWIQAKRLQKQKQQNKK
jgi:thiol-disulfide isomerase/thioredoxin